MGKKPQTSPARGPIALVLAAVMALGAAVLGLDPAALRPDPANPAVAAQQPSAAGQPAADRTAAVQRQASRDSDGSGQWPDFLPAEARQTVTLVQRGGPFPYRQDGSTFGNRERRLPARERGWYREYTVPTPGLSHRGARRIVTGGQPPREWYYTADHYDSFRSFTPPARTH